MEPKSSREGRLWEKIVDLVQEVDWLWNDLADVEDAVQRYYKNNVSKNAVRLNPSSRLMRVPRNTAAAAQLVSPSQHYFPFSSSFSASPIVSVVGDGSKGSTGADGAASTDEYQRNDGRVPQRRTVHLTESRLQKKLLESYVIPASTDMKHALSCVKLLRDECITALESVTMTAHLLDEPVAFVRRHGERYRFDQRYQEKAYEWKINARSRRIIATGDGRRASRDVRPLNMRPGYSGGGGRSQGGNTDEKHLRVIREACRGVPPARIVELLLDPSQKTSLWKLREKCTAAMYMYHDFLQSSIADTNPTVVTESPGVRVFGDYTESYTNVRPHSPTFPRTSLHDSIARVAGTKSLSETLPQTGAGAGAANVAGVSATAKKTSGSPSAAQRYGGVGGDEVPEFVTRKAFRDTVGMSVSLAGKLSASSSGAPRSAATTGAQAVQKPDDGQKLKSTAVTEVATSTTFVSPKKEAPVSVSSKSTSPSGMVAVAGYNFTPQPRTEAKVSDSSTSATQDSTPTATSVPGSAAGNTNAKQVPPPVKSSPFAAFSFTTFGVGGATAGVSLPAPSSILSVSSPASALAAVGVPSAPALAMRKKISTSGGFSIPATSAAVVATSMPPPTPKAADVNAEGRPTQALNNNTGSEPGCAASPPALSQGYLANTQDKSSCSTPTVATPITPGLGSPGLQPVSTVTAALPIPKISYVAQSAAVYSATATFSSTTTSGVVSPTNRVTATYTSTNTVVAVASPPSSPIFSANSARGGEVAPMTLAPSPVTDQLPRPESVQAAVKMDLSPPPSNPEVDVAQTIIKQLPRAEDTKKSDPQPASPTSANKGGGASASNAPCERAPSQTESAQSHIVTTMSTQKSDQIVPDRKTSSTAEIISRGEKDRIDAVQVEKAAIGPKGVSSTAASSPPATSSISALVSPAPPASASVPSGSTISRNDKVVAPTNNSSSRSTDTKADPRVSQGKENGVKASSSPTATSPENSSRESQQPKRSSLMKLIFLPAPEYKDKVEGEKPKDEGGD